MWTPLFMITPPKPSRSLNFWGYLGITCPEEIKTKNPVWSKNAHGGDHGKIYRNSKEAFQIAEFLGVPGYHLPGDRLNLAVSTKPFF